MMLEHHESIQVALMALLSNGKTGPTFLGMQVEFLCKEPTSGSYTRGNVVMNSNMKLLWTEVSFWMGEEIFFKQEVLLHSEDVQDFTGTVLKMLNGEPGYYVEIQKPTHYGFEREVFFDVCSPELVFKVTQRVYTPEKHRKMYEDFPEDAQDEESIKEALTRYLSSEMSQELLNIEYEPFVNESYSYEVLLVVDVGIGRGSDGVSGEGPAMYLEPHAEDLTRFIQDLRSEAEVTLLLS
jgi:hypothetical protein